MADPGISPHLDGSTRRKVIRGRRMIVTNSIILNDRPVLNNFFDAGDPSPERDGEPAHRAHAGAHGDRRDGALAPDEGRPDVVAAGAGPRRNRDADGGGEGAEGGGEPHAARFGAGEVRGAGVGVEGAVRRDDHWADEADWGVVRLGKEPVHAGRGVEPGGARDLRAAV